VPEGPKLERREPAVVEGSAIEAGVVEPTAVEPVPVSVDVPAPSAAAVVPSVAVEPVVPVAPASDPAVAGPVAPTAAPAKEPTAAAKPKAPKVKVKLRIVPMLGKGELKIGKTVHVVGTASYDLMLAVGKHAVKWRAEGSDAWIDRPALVLATGYDYLLHVAPKAAKLTPRPASKPTPKETP